ncbi:MAG TPA: SAF domain-containing protein, partial [Patescibacteria group bacterium]|nr:SAF domain-containing protein [Patescibacteria group bacterium]
QFRKSLFVVKDVMAGEKFTTKNVRSIRPGQGLAPKHYHEVIDRQAAINIDRGTPLEWNLIK